MFADNCLCDRCDDRARETPLPGLALDAIGDKASGKSFLAAFDWVQLSRNMLRSSEEVRRSQKRSKLRSSGVQAGCDGQSPCGPDSAPGLGPPSPQDRGGALRCTCGRFLSDVSSTTAVGRDMNVQPNTSCQAKISIGQSTLTLGCCLLCSQPQLCLASALCKRFTMVLLVAHANSHLSSKSRRHQTGRPIREWYKLQHTQTAGMSPAAGKKLM